MKLSYIIAWHGWYLTFPFKHDKSSPELNNPANNSVKDFNRVSESTLNNAVFFGDETFIKIKNSNIAQRKTPHDMENTHRVTPQVYNLQVWSCESLHQLPYLGINVHHTIHWPINLPLLTTSLLSCMATLWADRSAAAASSAAAAALLLLAPSPAPSPAISSSWSRSSLDWARTPVQLNSLLSELTNSARMAESSILLPFLPTGLTRPGSTNLEPASWWMRLRISLMTSPYLPKTEPSHFAKKLKLVPKYSVSHFLAFLSYSAVGPATLLSAALVAGLGFLG